MVFKLLWKIKYLLSQKFSWNHMGNMRLAEKMISSAKKAGADFVNFKLGKLKD